MATIIQKMNPVAPTAMWLRDPALVRGKTTMAKAGSSNHKLNVSMQAQTRAIQETKNKIWWNLPNDWLVVDAMIPKIIVAVYVATAKTMDSVKW